MAHQPVEDEMRELRRHVAVGIAGKRDPGIVGALVERRFEIVPDEDAMLRLQRQRVLRRHHQDGAAERGEIEAAREAGRHLDAVDLVAMESGADIENRSRARTAQDEERQIDPAAIGELDRAQPRLDGLAADELDVGQSQRLVGGERFFVHAILPLSPEPAPPSHRAG
jgi:hypothetical protein